MSAILHPIPVDLPYPLQLPVELPRDLTTETVLRYFEDSVSQADTFDHLVAICWRATRPYFLHDRHGSFTVVGAPQFRSCEGGRNGYEVRKEGSAEASTREWIQTWLLSFLAPYRGRLTHELIGAADNDEFRYLGNLCRSRFIDAVRTELAAKNTVPPHVSLDSPITEDGNTLMEQIGTARQDAPSSLARGNCFEEFLGCVSDVFHAIAVNREELRKLDLLDGLRAILGNADQIEALSKREYERLVIQSVARTRQVSPRSAAAYLRRFRATISRELALDNPAVRSIFLELETTPPVYTHASSASKETMDAPLATGALTESYFEANGCAWDSLD